MQEQYRLGYGFWLSSASLVCGFCVWMFWSVVSVLMLQLDFPFGPTELFSLIAIAGLAGGSLRITFGFGLPPIADQRLLLLVMLLLMLPVVATNFLLKREVSLWVLQLLALLTGLGGGLFSVFVASVNALSPRSEQIGAISFGTGLGHLGIVASLILLPLLAAFSGWALMGSEELAQVLKGSTVLGSREVGALAWIQHISYVWLSLLVPVVLMLCISLRSKLAGVRRVALPSTELPPVGASLFRLLMRTSLALLLGLGASAVGLWLILPKTANGGGFELSPELILSLVMIGTLMLSRWLSGMGERGAYQPYAIFNNKHTWVMSVLSAMSLGTFLGFSAALPLTLQLVFGYSHLAGGVHIANVNAPGIFIYAWMGPLLGVLMRPLGNWMASHYGGARTTQHCAVVLFSVSASAAYFLAKAYHSTEPEQYFLPFLLLLLVLFAAAGIAHASISHSVKRLFPATQLTYITIWLSAIAAYGVFYIPQLMSMQLARNTPEYAMIGFALFYAVCLLLNGWFYLRRDSAIFNP